MDPDSKSTVSRHRTSPPDPTITPADADTNTAGHQVALAEPDAGGDPTQTAIAVAVRDAQNNMNAYTLTVTRAAPAAVVLPGGCDILPLSENTDGDLEGTNRWTPECHSILEYLKSPGNQVLVTGHTKFYAFTTNAQSDVTIEVTSNTSRHILVRNLDGSILGHVMYLQDEAGRGDGCIPLWGYRCALHPRLQMSLDAGTYLIEAVQHYSLDGRQRDHTITVASDSLGERPELAVTRGPLLESLTLSGINLSPRFAPERYDYRMWVHYDTSHTTVTATPADEWLDVSIWPADADSNTEGHQLNLRPGHLGNLIIVSIETPDGFKRIHQLIVERLPPKPHLTSLSLTDATLSPEFSQKVFNYTAAVASDVEEVTLSLERLYSIAKIRITPDDSDPDTPGHQVSLSPGNNTVEVKVYYGKPQFIYAPDFKVYRIQIHR